MFNGKKGESNTLVFLLLGGIALMLAMQPGGFLNNSSSGSSTTTSSGSTNTVNVVGKVDTPATSATLNLGSAVDKYAPSTAVSNIYHRLILNGADLGLFADGSTKTVTAGDTVHIVTAANSSGATPGFYANQVTFKVGNKGAYTASGLWDTSGNALSDVTYVSGAKDAFQIVGNATPTITMFDSNSQPMTAGVTAQAIGAGDTGRCLQVKVTGVSKKAFSPFGAPEVICNMNKYFFKQIYGTDMNGNVLPSGQILKQFVPAAPAGEQLANITGQSFVLPNGFLGNADTSFKVCFVSDDTNDPNALANATCNIYDQNLYRNTLTGAIASGYEDNTGTDVGTSTVPTFTYGVS